MPGTLLQGAYQKPAKKSRVPKKGGEKGDFHTQVGELDDEMKEPSPAMKIKRAAQDEKHMATRRWIAGEISDRQHAGVHRRANHAIKNARKLGARK